MYNTSIRKIEKLLNTIFQRMFFFVFCLFCFMLLSNNTLHVMLYTYICYWNTFQYKYIYFSCRKIMSCASDIKRYLFSLYHIISLPISVLLVLFHEALLLFRCLFSLKNNLKSRTSKQEGENWESKQLYWRSLFVFGVHDFLSLISKTYLLPKTTDKLLL